MIASTCINSWQSLFYNSCSHLCKLAIFIHTTCSYNYVNAISPLLDNNVFTVHYKKYQREFCWNLFKTPLQKCLNWHWHLNVSYVCMYVFATYICTGLCLRTTFIYVYSASGHVYIQCLEWFPMSLHWWGLLIFP